MRHTSAASLCCRSRSVLLCPFRLGLVNQLLLVLVLLVRGSGLVAGGDRPLVRETVEEAQTEGSIAKDLYNCRVSTSYCMFCVGGNGRFGRRDVVVWRDKERLGRNSLGDAQTYVDSGGGRHDEKCLRTRLLSGWIWAMGRTARGSAMAGNWPGCKGAAVDSTEVKFWSEKPPVGREKPQIFRSPGTRALCSAAMAGP